MLALEMDNFSDTLHLVGGRNKSEYISMEDITLQLVMESKSKININAIPCRS
jgi:hypothetical protein